MDFWHSLYANKTSDVEFLISNDKIFYYTYKYEGAGTNIPSTNNACESSEFSVIKKKYTMRNKLHLSSFLPKIEQMLYDWSMASSSNAFVSQPSISSDLELCAFKWSNNIDKVPIIHWFHSWDIVSSSITAAVCLHMYQLQQWTSFANFVIWLRCCWLVCPMYLSKYLEIWHMQALNWLTDDTQSIHH